MEPKKKAQYASPKFCTRDVDRRYCGDGAWISQSDRNGEGGLHDFLRVFQ